MFLKNLILYFIIFLSGCVISWKDKIYKQDKEFIIKGRYPYHSIKIEEDGEYKEIVSNLRKEIEDKIIFDKIVKTYFEIDYPPFNFRMAMLDKERNNLIIRYFSRFFRPKIYAGIMIEFIYSLNEKKIDKIYVDLIPLE
jgi:hypothetical protein